MLLLDDIRARKALRMPGWVTNPGDWARHTGRVSEILRGTSDLPVFAIDPVAHAYFGGSEQEYWSLEYDFPPLVPPCELAWFEYKLPRRIRSAAKGDTLIGDLHHSRGRVGLLMIGSERADVEGEGLPREVRWVLTSELFIDYGCGNIQGTHGSIHIAADAEGKLVGRPWMQTFAPDCGAHVISLITFTHPALLAFSVVDPPATLQAEGQGTE
jgi:hypothetical protein